MEKKIYLFLLVCLSLFMGSCSDEEVAIPTADFNVSATEVDINETVTFTYKGENATQVVFFPGDEGHVWAEVDNGSTGLVMSKGVGTYAYKKAGVYTATVVATTYNDKAEVSNKSVKEVTITVNDNDNTLESIILQKDLYNKEMEAEINDDYVFIGVPYKVNVKNKDIAVKMNAQRLIITASSANATVKVNAADYDVQTKYDLTSPMTIDVISASGSTKTYNVYALHYPVFETFSVAGVKGTTTYSPYDYDKSYVNITVPAGTDLTKLVPTFSSADAKSISIDGSAQESDKTAVDFSSPVTYTLTNTVDGNSSIGCQSQVIVTVSVK